MGQQQKKFNLVQGQKASAQTQYVQDLTVNVSPILTPVLDAQGFIQQEPGLTQYGTGIGIDRGGVWNDRFQQLYRVSGDALIRVDGAGAILVLATSPTPLLHTQAAMPYSFHTQMIVIDEKAYLYDATTVTQITDPGISTPIDCVWIDGYYIFTDGSYLYNTELTNEYAISPLAYATSEFSPDYTLGVGQTTDNKLIAFNRFSIEFFENVANEFFAFTRIPSRNIQYGIIGTYCKANLGGDWYIIGGATETEVSVFRLGVGTAVNISCRAVDNIIKQYSQRDMLFAASLEIRVINNYPYLIMRLPNDVLMYNFKVAEAAGNDLAWTALSSGIGSGYPYRATHGVYDPRISKWTYGDTLTDTLGYLDFDVATHYLSQIECVMTTTFMYLETASIDELMIQTIPGFTVESDATVFFSLTYDGVVWSPEFSMEYGEPSAYQQRFIAFMLGYCNNYLAFRFRWVSKSRMAFASGAMLYG